MPLLLLLGLVRLSTQKRLHPHASAEHVRFDGLTFFHVMWYVTPLVLIAIGITAWRLKNWHPALWLAAMGNLSVYVSAWIGDAPWWRAFCEAWLLPPAS